MSFKKFKVYFNIGVGFFCLACVALILVLCAVGITTISEMTFPIVVAVLFGPYFLFVNFKKLKKMKAAEQEQALEVLEQE